VIEGLTSAYQGLFRTLRPHYDGPASWLWFVGLARLVMLLVLTAGTLLLPEPVEFAELLIGIYLAAFASSFWYFVVLRRERSVSPVLTWTQMAVDFGVVVTTISLTKGADSFFTFLLVTVILEAGVLLGLVQGFVFATLASAYMMMLFGIEAHRAVDLLAHWYNFLIQGIAFFFTAFISGYWNQRLSRLKQFQRDILDNMNSGFLIADPKGVVRAINRAACDILGLVEGDTIGLHVDGVVKTASGAECPVTTALRSTKDFSSYEFHAERADGEPILLGLTTSRLHDEAGRMTGIITTFTDLTEMSRMRQELQQQDRLAVLGEMSAGLAHEIRNPLASIRGAMEELRRNGEDPVISRKLAEIAVRESDHLNQIVSGFLEFAREPNLRRSPVEMRALLGEVCAAARAKYVDARALAIVEILPPHPCEAICDETRIRQVFVNLVQNAIDASGLTGQVRVTLVPGPPVEVRVEDNGPGIPPDKVARVFEPFYTDKERGVGMGLAICMRIVSAHNGTIQAASRAEGGACLIVRLPAA
jgi:two-component system sensor histidine kinase PilS (NtrC family)